jgi:YVTN family beta-propeller protein
MTVRSQSRKAGLMAGVIIICGFCTGCPKDSGFTVKATDVYTLFGVTLYSVGHGGANIIGNWVNDLTPPITGSVTSFNVITGDNGKSFVSNGRLPAVWESTVVNWGPGPCGPLSMGPRTGLNNVTNENPVISWDCIAPVIPFLGAFSANSSAPSTVTVQGLQGLSSQFGMPKVRLFGPDGSLISDTFATSVSADGTSATFPFPHNADGTSLAAGSYAMNLWNAVSPGTYGDLGAGLLSVGSNNTANQSPFGVDAVTVTVSSLVCISSPPRGRFCNSGRSSTPTPVLTLLTTGNVFFKGRSIAVGSQPIAVKAYRVATQSTTSSSSSETITISTTQPSLALVANYGSNTVSIVNLFQGAVVQTLAVGAQPVAIAITEDQSKAYVASSGSGTVSEIDLTSNAVTRTATVGLGASSLVMDPAGTAIWVGGTNYIEKLDLTSLSSLATFPVSGTVTSMAYSTGTSSLIYTVVTDTAFRAETRSVTSGVTLGTFANMDLAPASSSNSSAAFNPFPRPPALVVSGAITSANYSNGLAVVATPTGFVLLDLSNNQQLLSGSTPSTIHGIATDPAQGAVFFTLPDSNGVLTVPLPQL